MGSVEQELREDLEAHGLIGSDAYGPVPVGRRIELGPAHEAEVLESVAVQALMRWVLRLAAEVDRLRAEAEKR
jgi:hypothetical protein